jgi:hypothetical protein
MTQYIILTFALFIAAVIAAAFYYKSIALKFLSLLFVVILANMIYFTFDGVKGWPAIEKQEVKGTLATVIIINPSEVSAGAIIISLFPSVPQKWYEYEYPNYAPKTYYLEYSNDRAAEFEKAKQAMIEGREVRINGIPPKNAPGNMESDGSDSISEFISGIVEKLLPSQKDTYKPKIPDIEIMEREITPEKGTQQ